MAKTYTLEISTQVRQDSLRASVLELRKAFQGIAIEPKIQRSALQQLDAMADKIDEISGKQFTISADPKSVQALKKEKDAILDQMKLMEQAVEKYNTKLRNVNLVHQQKLEILKETNKQLKEAAAYGKDDPAEETARVQKKVKGTADVYEADHPEASAMAEGGRGTRLPDGRIAIDQPRAHSVLQGLRTRAINERDTLQASPHTTPEELALNQKKILAIEAETALLLEQNTVLAEALRITKENAAVRAQKVQEAQVQVEKAQQDVAATAVPVDTVAQIKEATAATTQLRSQTVEYGGAVEKAVAKGERLSDGLRDAGEVQATFLEKFQKFLQFTAVSMVFQQIRRFVTGALAHVRELDKVLTSIATVSNKTRQELWGMSVEFGRMAREMGISTVAVAEASDIFYKQGKRTAEVMELAKASIISASIAGIATEDSSNRMTAALNGFVLPATEAMVVADKFAALAAKSATSFHELSFALSKTASSAYVAGIDIDHMLALLAKTIETTREAPENIGTAFKTIIARLQQITGEGDFALIDGEDVMSADAINNADVALRSIGISVRDASGQFRDLQDVFNELGAKWDDLDRNTKSYLATVIAGARQQSRFFGVMTNYDRTLELVRISQESAGEASRQFVTHLTGIEAQANKLAAAMQQLYSKIFDHNAYIGLITTIRILVESMGAMSSAGVILTTVVLGFAAALVVMFHAKLRTTEGLQELTQATWKATVSMMKGAAGAVAKMAAVAGLAAAIVAIIGVVVYFTTVTRRNTESRIKNINALKTARTGYQREADVLEKLIDEYQDLERILVKTDDQKKRAAEINHELIYSYPHLIDRIDAEGKAYLNTRLALEQLATAREQARVTNLKLAQQEIDHVMKTDIDKFLPRLETSEPVGGDFSESPTFSTRIVNPLKEDRKLLIEFMTQRDFLIQQYMVKWGEGLEFNERKIISSIARSIDPQAPEYANNLRAWGSAVEDTIAKAIDQGVIGNLIGAQADFQKEMLAIFDLDATINETPEGAPQQLPTFKNAAASVEEYVAIIDKATGSLRAAGIDEALWEGFLHTGNKTVDMVVAATQALNSFTTAAERSAMASNLGAAGLGIMAQYLGELSEQERIDELPILIEALSDTKGAFRDLGRGLDLTDNTSVADHYERLTATIKNLGLVGTVAGDALWRAFAVPLDQMRTSQEIYKQTIGLLQSTLSGLDRVSEAYKTLHDGGNLGMAAILDMMAAYPALSRHIDVFNGKVTIQKEGLRLLWSEQIRNSKRQVKDNIREMESTKRLTQIQLDRYELLAKKSLFSIQELSEQLMIRDLGPDWISKVNSITGIMEVYDLYDKRAAQQVAADQERNTKMRDALREQLAKDTKAIGDWVASLEVLNKTLDETDPLSGRADEAEKYQSSLEAIATTLEKIAYLQNEMSMVGRLRGMIKDQEVYLKLLEVEKKQIEDIGALQAQARSEYQTKMGAARQSLTADFGSVVSFDASGLMSVVDGFESVLSKMTDKQVTRFDELVESLQSNSSAAMDMKNAILDNNQLLIENSKARMDNTFRNEMQALAKVLWPEGREAAEAALEDRKAHYEKFIEGKEKEYELDILRQEIEKEMHLAATESQKESLKESLKAIDALRDSDTTRTLMTRRQLEMVQKEYNVKRLQFRLENLRNQKTIQTLVKLEDGTWQFQYEADISEVEDAEEELRESQIELIKFQRDSDLAAAQERLDNLGKFYDEVQEVINKALDGQFATGKEFYDALQQVHERFGQEVYFGDNETSWKAIGETFVGSTQKMTLAYTEYARIVAEQSVIVLNALDVELLRVQGLTEVYNKLAIAIRNARDQAAKEKETLKQKFADEQEAGRQADIANEARVRAQAARDAANQKARVAAQAAIQADATPTLELAQAALDAAREAEAARQLAVMASAEAVTATLASANAATRAGTVLAQAHALRASRSMEAAQVAAASATQAVESAAISATTTTATVAQSAALAANEAAANALQLMTEESILLAAELAERAGAAADLASQASVVAVQVGTAASVAAARIATEAATAATIAATTAMEAAVMAAANAATAAGIAAQEAAKKALATMSEADILFAAEMAKKAADASAFASGMVTRAVGSIVPVSEAAILAGRQAAEGSLKAAQDGLLAVQSFIGKVSASTEKAIIDLTGRAASAIERAVAALIAAVGAIAAAAAANARISQNPIAGGGHQLDPYSGSGGPEQGRIIVPRVPPVTEGGPPIPITTPITDGSNTIREFHKGGVADFTGPAMLHGSPSQSEVIFNASQAKKLYDMIANAPSLINFNKFLPQKLNTSISGAGSVSNITYNIDRLEFPNVFNVNDIREAIEGLPRYVIQHTKTNK